MRGKKYGVPAIGMLLIVMGLLTRGVQSIFNGGSSFSEYGGVIIDSSEEVTLSNSEVKKAGSTITADGTSSGTAVTISSASPSPLASTGVVKGNWYYRVDVNAITGTTPASTTFKVELYRWSSINQDYSLLSTLYVKSDGTPATGEKARTYFDLGGSAPGASEAFRVLVTRA